MTSKTILITGASTGIGFATAKLFHSKGWNVVATMRNPEKHTELDQLEPSRMLIQKLDVLDTETMKAAIDTAIMRWDQIDVLVNNAGHGQYGPFELTDEAAWRNQFNVNLFGPMRLTKLLLPHFRTHPSAIINVSSGGGLYALPNASLYCSSKFALEGWTEAMHHELKPFNIMVKSVVPHGGVSSTAFGSNAAAHMPNTSSTGGTSELVALYASGMQKMTASMKSSGASSAISADEVAKIILEGVEDGRKDKFRYFAGNDASGFLKARYESRDDDEYMAYMSANFS